MAVEAEAAPQYEHVERAATAHVDDVLLGEVNLRRASHRLQQREATEATRHTVERREEPVGVEVVVPARRADQADAWLVLLGEVEQVAPQGPVPRVGRETPAADGDDMTPGRRGWLVHHG